MLEDEPETADRMVEQAAEVEAGPGSSEDDRARVRRREQERLDRVRNEVDTAGLGYRLRREWRLLGAPAG